MNKYKPLADYLHELTTNEARLHFSDVSRIIGAELPRSARLHHAWWANSRTNDSHSWAHQWLAAGWERGEYSLPEEWVVFRRTEHYDANDPRALEGYSYDARVLLRTRNAALAAARKFHDDYTCQACGFRLRVGNSYVIEAHHIEPLSGSEETETTIHMLISLCPTCHRIAHLRSTPYTVTEITQLLHSPETEPSTHVLTNANGNA